MSKTIVANLGPFDIPDMTVYSDLTTRTSPAETNHRLDEMNDSISRSISPNDVSFPNGPTNDPNQISKWTKTIGDYLDFTKLPQSQQPYEDFPLPEKVIEMVEHPSHYNMSKYECIDVLQEVLKDLDGFEGFCIGNVMKYCWRLKYKGKPLEDAKKAAFYLKRCIDYMENANEQKSIS